MQQLSGAWVGAIIFIALVVIALVISTLLKRRKRNPVKLQLQRSDKDFIVSEADLEDDSVGPVRIRNLDNTDTSQEATASTKADLQLKNNHWPKVMCIYVKAKPHEQFYGYDLMQAILNQGFVHGAQQFFHYSDGHRTLFSLASLESPGSFDLDNVGAFKTAGICLFFQPPRFTKPEAIFDHMYSIAAEIADELGGVVEDEHHHLMTPERLNDWRSKVA